MSEREEVIKILMERDGLTRREAIEAINECAEAMIEEQSDDAIVDYLGLEPDYIFGVLGY